VDTRFLFFIKALSHESINRATDRPPPISFTFAIPLAASIIHFAHYDRRRRALAKGKYPSVAGGLGILILLPAPRRPFEFRHPEEHILIPPPCNNGGQLIVEDGEPLTNMPATVFDGGNGTGLGAGTRSHRVI
jgi:hypothetical protein